MCVYVRMYVVGNIGHVVVVGSPERVPARKLSTRSTQSSTFYCTTNGFCFPSPVRTIIYIYQYIRGFADINQPCGQTGRGCGHKRLA